MARIAVGGFQHETNTFAPLKASWADFERADAWPPFVRGPQLIDAVEGFNIPIAGAVSALQALGHELVPLCWCSAAPSSYVEREAYEMAGQPFNIGSPKQLAQVLFQELGLPIVKKTKTGPSTDADVLEELAATSDLVASGTILSTQPIQLVEGGTGKLQNATLVTLGEATLWSKLGKRKEHETGVTLVGNMEPRWGMKAVLFLNAYSGSMLPKPTTSTQTFNRGFKGLYEIRHDQDTHVEMACGLDADDQIPVSEMSSILDAHFDRQPTR